ncbi:hypothetical protein ACVIGB_008709 [Bradyrhizobium sp. USDA 4341]
MKFITIGKRLVAVEHVAFVEPFDPSASPEFKPEKEYKGRVVLLEPRHCSDRANGGRVCRRTRAAFVCRGWRRRQPGDPVQDRSV